MIEDIHGKEQHMTSQMQKEQYMRRAIELAKSATGHTHPNPLVGCVVVKDGRIISEACHERYGEYHAERNALMRCTEDTKGAELYVTLEPCCHQGKTPPCTDIIIEKGISRVYVGSGDPNPKVAGKGYQILRSHGIEVEEGILEKECLEMNEIFFHYITTNRPLVAMKYAMTLDGKIATYSGSSQWITGEQSREHVHYLRKKYCAIMAGIGTVLADNPMLNCRIQDGVDPVRIICDTHLRIPIDSNIVKTSGNIPTIIACDENILAEGSTEENSVRNMQGGTLQGTTQRTIQNTTQKIQFLKEKGIKLVGILLNSSDGQIDMKMLIERLGSEEKIDSILVEGGGTINASLIEHGLVDKVYCYIAPKIVGGRDSKTPVEGQGIEFMKDALTFTNGRIKMFGEDVLLEYDVENKRR